VNTDTMGKPKWSGGIIERDCTYRTVCVFGERELEFLSFMG
jgi:hypothetical protein